MSVLAAKETNGIDGIAWKPPIRDVSANARAKPPDQHAMGLPEQPKDRLAFTGPVRPTLAIRYELSGRDAQRV
jgi:hypothetical protein